jgi:hypothetical protein
LESMDVSFFGLETMCQPFSMYFGTKEKQIELTIFSKQHPTSHHHDMRSTYLVSQDGTTNNYFAQLQQNNKAQENQVSTNSEEMGKGVLISKSGLHLIMSLKDPLKWKLTVS